MVDVAKREACSVFESSGQNSQSVEVLQNKGIKKSLGKIIPRAHLLCNASIPAEKKLASVYSEACATVCVDQIIARRLAF